MVLKDKWIGMDREGPFREENFGLSTPELSRKGDVTALGGLSSFMRCSLLWVEIYFFRPHYGLSIIPPAPTINPWVLP